MRGHTIILALATFCMGFSQAQFAEDAEFVSNAQLTADMSALSIAYNSDFAKKWDPSAYSTVSSESILELSNSAKYALENVKQSGKYGIASYLCFTEPATAGCEHFNELGCSAVNSDCGDASSSRNAELATLCTIFKDGTKSVEDGCFIVSLRQSSDGSSRNSIAPWNHAVQDWVDTHNCTSLMYHLKYRCFANLIKWDDVEAQEEYVDLSQLFEATFGITAISSFNDEKPLECASLNFNDRKKFLEAVEIQVETAVIRFVTTAADLARFGLSAADVVLDVPEMQGKLRTTLLINLFYDGAVGPFRGLCCALNACYDYHPLEVFSDKLDALSTFYPGGFARLQDVSEPFATEMTAGKNILSHGVDAGYAYTHSVLTEAPAKAAWQAATSDDIKDIEAF